MGRGDARWLVLGLLDSIGLNEMAGGNERLAIRTVQDRDELRRGLSDSATDLESPSIETPETASSLKDHNECSNLGDTRTTSYAWLPASNPLNEGRRSNPGDTGAILRTSHYWLTAQRRPEIKPRRHGRHITYISLLANRSTKAGDQTPATRAPYYVHLTIG